MGDVYASSATDGCSRFDAQSGVGPGSARRRREKQNSERGHWSGSMVAIETEPEPRNSDPRRTPHRFREDAERGSRGDRKKTFAGCFGKRKPIAWQGSVHGDLRSLSYL